MARSKKVRDEAAEKDEKVPRGISQYLDGDEEGDDDYDDEFDDKDGNKDVMSGS